MTNNYKYLPIEAFIKDDAPIDLINELSVDDFPIDVFPEDIQILFKKLNESLNYNYDVMAVTFMSIISTINGNKVKLLFSVLIHTDHQSNSPLLPVTKIGNRFELLIIYDPTLIGF